MSKHIAGSCLCGGVRFEIELSSIAFMSTCHCTSCQKSTGSAFSAALQVAKEGFHWTEGEAQVRTFESTPGVHRAFCSMCGSRVPQATDFNDYYSVPAGVIDDDLDQSPQVEMWIEEKATWYVLSGGIPSCEGRGSPEFWSDLLGGTVEQYRDIQKDLSAHRDGE